MSESLPLFAPAAVTLCVLASGSSGNSIYVDTGKCRLLVDAGLPLREIEARLSSIDVDIAGLDAVLLSHEHHDHVQGVGPLARRHEVKVLATAGTLKAAKGKLGRLQHVELLTAGRTLDLGELSIHPFRVSHDAADPVCFALAAGGVKIGIVTDLGCSTTLVKQAVAGCRALVLEHNHDYQMLMDGPYPWPLKQRIRSRHGHLSNEDAGALLGELLHPRLDHVFLAHLSQTNNRPELAQSSAEQVLGNHRERIVLTHQHRPSRVVRLARDG